MNPKPDRERTIAEKLLHSPWTSILVPAAIGLGIGYFAIVVTKFYGLSLFIGLPILISFLAAFFHSFRREISFKSAYGISCLAILTHGIMILLCSLDGLICLLMALPLALLLGLIGTALGRLIGKALTKGAASFFPVILIFLLPCLVAFEADHQLEAPLRKVTTQIEINAPIDRVWETVIAFPRIDSPPNGIFRFGIAYPIEATIEGHGIGAIRYCKFCTGDFVEPITVWQENEMLAFKVTSSPPPMDEISIYKHIDPPHLHGHMASEKGQFRLEQHGSRVILEGTTWYRHEMWPQWYWIPMTDYIVHTIHHRVLDHIKVVAESAPSH